MLVSSSFIRIWFAYCYYLLTTQILLHLGITSIWILVVWLLWSRCKNMLLVDHLLLVPNNLINHLFGFTIFIITCFNKNISHSCLLNFFDCDLNCCPTFLLKLSNCFTTFAIIFYSCWSKAATESYSFRIFSRVYSSDAKILSTN